MEPITPFERRMDLSNPDVVGLFPMEHPALIVIEANGSKLAPIALTVEVHFEGHPADMVVTSLTIEELDVLIQFLQEAQVFAEQAA